MGNSTRDFDTKMIRNVRRWFDTDKKELTNTMRFRCKIEKYAAAKLQRCIINNGGWKRCAILVGDSGLYSSSKWKMTSVWKRLQRVGKKASKFQFTASYQSLTVECVRGGKWWVCTNLVVKIKFTPFGTLIHTFGVFLTSRKFCLSLNHEIVNFLSQLGFEMVCKNVLFEDQANQSGWVFENENSGRQFCKFWFQLCAISAPNLATAHSLSMGKIKWTLFLVDIPNL